MSSCHVLAEEHIDIVQYTPYRGFFDRTTGCFDATQAVLTPSRTLCGKMHTGTTGMGVAPHHVTFSQGVPNFTTRVVILLVEISTVIVVIVMTIFIVVIVIIMRNGFSPSPLDLPT